MNKDTIRIMVDLVTDGLAIHSFQNCEIESCEDCLATGLLISGGDHIKHILDSRQCASTLCWFGFLANRTVVEFKEVQGFGPS